MQKQMVGVLMFGLVLGGCGEVKKAEEPVPISLQQQFEYTKQLDTYNDTRVKVKLEQKKEIARALVEVEGILKAMTPSDVEKDRYLKAIFADMVPGVYTPPTVISGGGMTTCGLTTCEYISPNQLVN